MGVSIHALREEGDGRLRYFGHQAEIISIHALREEGDDKHALVVKLLKIFLSTPSARRATAASRSLSSTSIHFYPRPPRGGRPTVLRAVVPHDGISIHALREEGDHRSLFRSAQKIDFYPRPPRGGRPTSSLPSWRGGNFYPRPPRGGRQAYKTDGWVGLAFLSTPSARRATWPAHRGRRQIPISIHALREEGDVARCGDSVGNRRFLSTPSARRATVQSALVI